MRIGWTVLVGLLAACKSESEPEPEPLDLPADPSEPGAKVGVRTAEINGITVEVWYPTTEAVTGDPEDLDLFTFAPPEFIDRVGDTLSVPTLATRAWRDAPHRVLDEKLPLVLFSHGFGGFRSQSVDLTTHLASRGYVVVAPDHAGRGLYDVAPCLLNPAAGTCNLSFANNDVGDLTTVLDWALTAPDAIGDLVDPEQIGVFGHSAGGMASVAFTNAEPRVDAALPMAGAAEFTRDLPSLVFGGSCDGVVTEESLLPTGPSASEGYLALVDGGHMAFSDLCQVDLGGLGDDLASREDANDLFLSQMLTLAVDGCPGYTPPPDLAGCGGTYLDVETSAPVLRYVTAAFFDEHLKASGAGVDASTYPSLEVRGE
jgi:pimeloyl-ACP methyl ester carboxylesterase